MDIQYLLFLQRLRESVNGSFNSFLAFITMIAVDFYVVVAALIVFWAVNKRKGALVLTSLGVGCCLNAILKVTFCIYRPWIRSDKIHPLPEVISGATGYSFPSGHSTKAGAFYGALISAFRKHKGMCIFFGVMILLTMLSRNYVGVHTPQDVLVGAATGLLSALIMTKLLKLADRYKNADIWILVGSALLCTAALFYISNKSYPMDYVDGVLIVDPQKMMVDSFIDPGVFFGIILGWFIERRFIRFEIAGTKAQKVTRCLVGSLLYILYYTAVVVHFGKVAGNGMVYFTLQASAPLLFMTVYPILFTKLQKPKKAKSVKAEAA